MSSRAAIEQFFSLMQRLEEHPAKRKHGLDGYCRTDQLIATLSRCRSVHAAMASSVSQTVSSPRRTNAASWSGQFVTQYLGLGNF